MDWKNVIEKIQARHGLTQPQIAEIVGCAQGSISHLVSGRTPDPRYSIGRKLLDLSRAAYPLRKPTRRKARATELAGEV